MNKMINMCKKQLFKFYATLFDNQLFPDYDLLWIGTCRITQFYNKRISVRILYILLVGCCENLDSVDIFP